MKTWRKDRNLGTLKFHLYIEEKKISSGEITYIRLDFDRHEPHPGLLPPRSGLPPPSFLES